MLSGLDLVVFAGSLALVMGVGLWAARREDDPLDFFLAGRSVGWWGVAGSVFGSNVSANHLVGMLGIGYSIGFAQSHFELGAIGALMLLAYGFLPVYRRMQIYTLSDYLGQRYDGRSRAAYTVILLLIAVIQLTGSFYIGSRSLGLLLVGSPVELGYVGGVAVICLITAAYTVLGGLTAVIYTDVIQSVFLLIAGIMVAVFTFAQPEVGGWTGLMAYDLARPISDQKMHLFLPSNHPDLPWTGAFSGLLILHCFYWSTNQTIVQRALAARSDRDARIGIIFAGFLKLSIPFFAIAGGVAAAQLFQTRDPLRVIDPDAAATELIRTVVPLGTGLVGLIMAGLFGAILSSIDSLVNSAATLVTFDVYKRHLRPDATDRECVQVGRLVLATLLGASAVLAVWTYDPNSAGNFFLRMSSQMGHFTPGLVVAFGLGMFWRGASPAGAAAAILLSPFFSFAIEAGYPALASASGGLQRAFGAELNFMHRVFLTVCFAAVVHRVVSARRPLQDDRSAFTVAGSGGIEPEALAQLLRRVGWMALGVAVVGAAIAAGVVPPEIGAILAAGLAWVPFSGALARGGAEPDTWAAAVLCSATLFILFFWF